MDLNRKVGGNVSNQLFNQKEPCFYQLSVMTLPHKHTGRSSLLPSPTQLPANLLILLKSLQNSCYYSGWMAPVLSVHQTAFAWLTGSTIKMSPAFALFGGLCGCICPHYWILVNCPNLEPHPKTSPGTGPYSKKANGSTVLGFLSLAAEPPRPPW